VPCRIVLYTVWCTILCCFKVMAVHSQSMTVPDCPSGWKGLWRGYSFAMVSWQLPSLTTAVLIVQCAKKLFKFRHHNQQNRDFYTNKFYHISSRLCIRPSFPSPLHIRLNSVPSALWYTSTKVSFGLTWNILPQYGIHTIRKTNCCWKRYKGVLLGYSTN